MDSLQDLDSLHKLLLHQDQQIRDNSERGKKWTQHKEEYEALYKRLENLCDQTSYPALIPVGGGKAFMSGTIQRTNEIMVLLGDNWFADRSVVQAKEICKRRIKKCDKMLQDLETEKKLFESWKKETTNVGAATHDEGAVDIKEDYDEEEERKWKEAHKISLKRSRESKSDDKENDNDDLWRRLDELEMREELQAANITDEEYEEESEDLSNSPELSDEDEGDRYRDNNEIVIHDPSFKNHLLKRRVSFGGVSVVEDNDEESPEPNIIKFTHTETKDSHSSSKELNPGHLKSIFDEPIIKSILKPFESSSISLAPCKTDSPPITEFKCVREPLVDPVQENIIERLPYSSSTEETQVDDQPQERRVSRFKLSRMK